MAALFVESRAIELENNRIPNGNHEFNHSKQAPPPVELESGKVPVDGTKPFAVTKAELRALTEDGGKAKLQNMGGVAGVATKLATNLSVGISASKEDIGERRKEFGINTHAEKPPRTLLFFVIEAMGDPLLQILFLCALVSIAVSVLFQGFGEGIYDAFGIFLALIIIISVTSISNWRQATQFSILSHETAKLNVEVLRGSHRQKILSDDLLVGDLVLLAAGDRVPADGILITSQALAIDESGMTGESELAHKDAISSPFVMSGCNVMEGYGCMLVTAVGEETEWGRAICLMTEDNDNKETPLQARLSHVATLMGHGGLAAAIALLVILSTRYTIQHVDIFHITATNITAFINFFMVAITVLVIAIPEGLPLAVALTLAFSVMKMMEDKSLVRHLAACETMGSATTICSDKTGTLTLNQMTVTDAWVAGSRVKAPGDLEGLVSPGLLASIFDSISQNTSGSVFQPHGEPAEICGSPTEKAILEWAFLAGLQFEHQRSLTSVLDYEVFSPAKKRMGVLLGDLAGDKWTRTVHWKGGAEVLLESCNSWVDSDGRVCPMDAKREEIANMMSSMAYSGLRCIALAYRKLPANEISSMSDRNLTFLAVMGIKDPCRPEVPEAVLKCQQAGVFLRMVTGDSLETAKAIARECGILSKDGLALLGSQLRALSPSEVPKVLPKVQVVARASPGDKLWLVQSLKGDLGEVVAVTGDGTNDAPALFESDIGLSMGVCGTEVAKQSSDIIITDDNFSSIVETIKWGRSVQLNIQCFLQFQITSTLVAVSLNLISSLVVGSAPLSAVQMLWVNLIQDTFGALALASEPPAENLLHGPPVNRKESLISPHMWRNIAVQTAYQLMVLLTLWFWGKQLLGIGPGGVPSAQDFASLTGLTVADEQLVTVTFNCFVFCQFFNEINCRKIDDLNVFQGLLKNHVFILILAIEIVSQVVMINFLPGKLTNTIPISLAQWGFCFIIGAVSVPWGMFWKVFPVPRLESAAEPAAQKEVLPPSSLPESGFEV